MPIFLTGCNLYSARTIRKQCVVVVDDDTVATRGSVLYFLIVTMGGVNCMYQTSLRQFLQLFDVAMTHSNRSPFTTKRIQNIIDYLTYLTFSYTTRGLYEADKFLFTVLMTLQIQMEAKTISQEEFQCFIKGAFALRGAACKYNKI